MKRARTWALFCASLLAATSALGCATAKVTDASNGGSFDSKPPITIILVRHAETEDEVQKDPALSDAGKSRAAQLAHIFANHEIGAVYSTDTKRTLETATPLAVSKNLNPIIYDSVEPLAAGLLRQHQGKTVLIVGHRPGIVELLRRWSHDGGEKGREFPEPRHEDLYIVTHAGASRVAVTRLQLLPVP